VGDAYVGPIRIGTKKPIPGEGRREWVFVFKTGTERKLRK
jgi:hypothetical protein